MLVLPQILLGLVLALRSLANPFTWRSAASGIYHAIRTRPLRSVAWLTVTVASVSFAGWALEPVERFHPSGDGLVEEQNWPTFHGDLSRSGTSVPPDATSFSQPQLRWQFRDSHILERRPFASSPAIANSRVVIGGDNFVLYCVDLETAKLHWTFQARWPIFSSPVIWNDRVYVGEGLHEQTDSKIYCLDLASGTELWSFETTSHTESSPTIVDGMLYFGAGDDGVYCLNALTGKVKWQYPGVHVDSAPLVLDDRVYFGSGYGYNGVLCVSASDGQLVWKRSFRAPVWGALSYSEERLYAAAGNGDFNVSAQQPYGEIRCLDPATGKDIWQFKGVKDAVHTAVAVRDNHAVFGSRDGACYALNAMTGALLWRVEVGAPILSSPAIVDNQVLFGANDGFFRCLRLDDGQEAWSFDTTGDMLFIMEDPSILSSPSVVDGNIVFGTSTGNVYCLANGIGQAPGDTEPKVAESGYQSRFMRAADFLAVGLIERLALYTGSHGVAIILAALILKLLLLPADWKQIQQIRKQRKLQPQIEYLQREYIDYRVHRQELRELHAAAGIRPSSTLLTAALQLPLFIVVFLVLQATSVFDGRPFIWITDLSGPDHAGQGVLSAWLGANLNALPLVLTFSIYIFSETLRPAGKRPGPLGRITWPLVAICIGLLTYRWPAALLLFTSALLWIGIIQHKVVSSLDLPAESSKHEK